MMDATSVDNNVDNDVNGMSEQERQELARYGARPETMWLADHEVAHAMAIKQGFRDRRKRHENVTTSSFREPTDFTYAHFALCADGESVETTLEKIEMMEAFKQEYKIQDTVEEGMELLTKFTAEFPGFILSLEYLESSRNYLSVIDWAAFYPSRVQTYDQWRTVAGGLYYKFQCKQCQFEATRDGSSVLAECMDASFENFNAHFF